LHLYLLTVYRRFFQFIKDLLLSSYFEGGENVARPEKEAVVKELTDKFNSAKSLVITDYLGLNVAEMTELRSKLREAGVEFKVVKNTLATIAANDVEMEEMTEYFSGPTAIAFGEDDAVSPAKILVEYAKDHEVLEIKAGLLNGEIISKEKVESLAEIPSREELLAKAFASMKAPLTGLVNVLQGNLRGLVQVLNQIKEEKA
jgi:large subunit ribosomal protein L10